MAARIVLRVVEFQRFAKLKWPATSDEFKARKIGVDPATYSRVTHGHQAPGGKFIAATLDTFRDDDIGFDDLYQVVSGDDASDDAGAVA